MSLRRVRLDVAYDGTDFAGWQLQPGARTVQGELERIFTRVHDGVRHPVRSAGRTDAGVHARAQVADVLVATRFGDDELLHMLRRMLPEDVRVWRVTGVDEGFHARRDCIAKTYSYRLDLGPVADPFARRFALHVPAAFDAARVRRALDLLPGRRDWSGFTAAHCVVRSRVRTLHEARLHAVEGGCELVFRADGFLTFLVRNLVGTLLEIARGDREPESIRAILETGDRRVAGPTASARGLCLVSVEYPR